jgi:DNA-binding XRE family transcriptional regulator
MDAVSDAEIARLARALVNLLLAVVDPRTDSVLREADPTGCSRQEGLAMSKLAAVLAERGITHSELARRADVSRPVVIAAVKGRDVSTDTWIKLACALDVNVYDISEEAYARIVDASAVPQLRDYLSAAELERFAAVMLRILESAAEERAKRAERAQAEPSEAES